MASKSPSKSARIAAAHDAYAKRTGMTSRAAIITVKSLLVPIDTTEDENGNMVRNWKPSEFQTFKHADIFGVLVNRVAVEMNEMLVGIPPSGIKYAVSKGWLVSTPSNVLFRITLQAAIDLKLPRTFKGGNLHGRRIPFVK